MGMLSRGGIVRKRPERYEKEEGTRMGLETGERMVEDQVSHNSPVLPRCQGTKAATTGGASRIEGIRESRETMPGP